jgi:hypothetical protein
MSEASKEGRTDYYALENTLDDPKNGLRDTGKGVPAGKADSSQKRGCHAGQ